MVDDIGEGALSPKPLENPEGVRFLIRSRVFSDEEIACLRTAGRI